MSAADVLAVPICIARQHQQHTDPRLAHYQVLIHLGTPENYGNCVAVAYGNNSGNAAEQLAFAEKLVRAYNRDDAVAELIGKADAVAGTLEMPTLVKQSTKNPNAGFIDWRDWCALQGEVAALRAALARVGGGK